MRKGALLLAVLMVATASTAALAAKKKKAKAPAKSTVVSTNAANQNELSAKFVRNGLHQFVVPFESTAAAAKK